MVEVLLDSSKSYSHNGKAFVPFWWLYATLFTWELGHHIMPLLRILIFDLFQFIFVMMFVNYNPARYGKDYYYPVWADALGWLIVASGLCWIPIVAVYKVHKEQKGKPLLQVIYHYYSMKDVRYFAGHVSWTQDII